jgi:hypothetical protein
MSRLKPQRAGGSRLWRAVQRVRNWSLTIALGVAVLVGGLLGQSTMATAQPVGPSLDPGFFSATGYRIGSPAVLDYFLHRGGVRTFGYPVSNEFPLLGQRVQIFQRQMLQLAADGSVSTATILDPDVLPISRIDGLSLPTIDSDMVAAAPVVGSDDYTTQALAFINVYVPDEWNGLTVNFQSTFLSTVTCADAFGTDPCDTSLLPAFALELWGLPTSLPTLDPLNTEFVYQRFQKGIMHYSRATGLTQGLLLGDWLKRVIIGVDLSPDISADVRTSRFYAQYAPSRPLALDRPADLPDTSLAQAFRADTLAVAGQPQLGQTQPEPTLPPQVAQTATSVAQTATAITGTQVSLQGTQAVAQGAEAGQTATALAATATAASANATPTATPGNAVSTIPVVNVGCLGDEQMWFTPGRPNTGTHVDISVTSQRHHDVRYVRLTGPIDPGQVTERVGPLGFVWTWTVTPSTADFHVWTFYADGLRPCISSGFNAYQPLGSTATPTNTPIPTNTPGNTPTPTPTIVPVPGLIDVTPHDNLTCNSIVALRGSGFGTPPSVFGTVAFLISTQAPITLTQIGTGSDTALRVQLPSSGLLAGPAAIQVSSGGGDSGTVPISIAPCSGDTGSATSTPTPAPPRPTISGVTFSTATLTCNTVVTIRGNNFGSPPSTLGTVAIVLSRGQQLTLTPIGQGSSTSIQVQMPSSGLVAGDGSIQVSNAGGDSVPTNVTLATTGCTP